MAWPETSPAAHPPARAAGSRRLSAKASSGIDPVTALRAVLIWSRLDGIVSLEIAGNFASIGAGPGRLLEIPLATVRT